jgi:serine/threonine protein kinase
MRQGSTVSREAAGALGYLDPELQKSEGGGRASPASDVYSLGGCEALRVICVRSFACAG